MKELKRLAEEARRSEHGEGYAVVHDSPRLRVGVGARHDGKDWKHFVEVTLRLRSDLPSRERAALEGERLGQIEQLLSMGFQYTSEDPFGTVMERPLSAKEVRPLLAKLERTLLQGLHQAP